ncbi:hypothetical protein B0A52_06029 [Exophiala mesophila]|uniref:FAD dependent oxidoreductase domain-containing protein n=1 Tax=Exophiala mesophila TaxID=212818 RepID=A0A438N536_EXOME|nr:hypothetical protein B0A52_06029 [Exophiala mesophila]
MSSTTSPVPKQILIIGAGEFGLSTALSLLSNPTYKSSLITIVDSSPSLPNPFGSSVDASRIVRADYASRPYSKLALQAQILWHDKSPDGWGGEERYHEPGFVLTEDKGAGGYLGQSLANVRSLAKENAELGSDVNKIKVLNGQDDIRAATGYDGVSGDSGYANFNSGWANAEFVVSYVLKKIKQHPASDRVTIRPDVHIDHLLFSNDTVIGAETRSGEQITADLTVIAAGAWSPALINLQGRCLATGQALAYYDITSEEQKAMEHRPTIMNMSRGIFIIPPRAQELKIARHGYGYRSMVKIPIKKIDPLSDQDGEVEVSLPQTAIPIPLEAEELLHAELLALIPHMKDRPLRKSRICWYCDTPSGNFLITYHPTYKNLFIATGGSGHGFKFFPVIGDKIVAAIEGTLDPELKQIWRWRTDDELRKEIGGELHEFSGCDDGSRSGRRGMILEEELKRTR